MTDIPGSCSAGRYYFHDHLASKLFYCRTRIFLFDLLFYCRTLTFLFDLLTAVFIGSRKAILALPGYVLYLSVLYIVIFYGQL